MIAILLPLKKQNKNKPTKTSTYVIKTILWGVSTHFVIAFCILYYLSTDVYITSLEVRDNVSLKAG